MPIGSPGAYGDGWRSEKKDSQGRVSSPCHSGGSKEHNGWGELTGSSMEGAVSTENSERESDDSEAVLPMSKYQKYQKN